MNGYKRKLRILVMLDAALAVAIVFGMLLSPRVANSRFARHDLLADAATVQSIRIGGAESVGLDKAGAAWTVIGDDGPLPADEARIASFIKAVDAVERLETVAKDASSRKNLGLDGDTARSVTFLDAKGKTLCSFVLGNYAQAPGSVYLALAGNPDSYSADSGMASYILGKRTSWLDLRAWVSPPAAESVQGLSLHGSYERQDGSKVDVDYDAVRSGSGWQAVGIALDASRVDAMIRSLAALRGEDYAPLAGPAASAALTVELRLGNGASLSLSVEPRRADGRYVASSSQRDRRLYLPAWALTEAVKTLADVSVTAQPGRP
ncbi:MAG: hypothetical protein CVV51_07220 [Spirochaetae bacterium HGW-Spirochaetae-7]|jgi:hypothetical protein|nr:MAG: hypothetical protein CVV51_07220 [Spirochaetae bacterium HGW-Spirochaetae-7]